MYAFIRGTLHRLEASYAIVETNGIGFKILIPYTTFTALKETGHTVFLHTSFVVREFSEMLYGFYTEPERDLFEILIEISGIGPKIALNLIGHLSIPALQEAIFQDDIAALSKVPGIGKKTAERLLVELRNKLETFFSKSISKVSPLSHKMDPHHEKAQDGIKALLHLGYSHLIAQRAVKKSIEINPECDLGALIAIALKHV